MSPFEIIAINPAPYVVPSIDAQISGVMAPDISIAQAAVQAGYSGIVDLAFMKSSHFTDRLLIAAMNRASGLRIGISQLDQHLSKIISLFEQATDKNLTIVLVPDQLGRAEQLLDLATANLVNRLKSTADISANAMHLNQSAGIRILIEVISVGEAKLVEKLTIDGLIAKGHEASGVVGDTTAFVLMQECLSQSKLPVFVLGGIGMHTAPACYAAGAAGIVLDSQLLLSKESALPVALKTKFEQFDGTEPSLLALSSPAIIAEHKHNKDGCSTELGRVSLRLYARFIHNTHSSSDQLKYLGLSLGENEIPSLETLYENIVLHNAKSEPTEWIVPLGQDIAFAGRLAEKYLSVSAILHALKNSIEEHIILCRKLRPFALQSPLAESHGTLFPIVQGAMTRVSDKAEFAYEVAQAGALPFLALALMRGAEAEILLKEAQDLLKNRSWGVGILGFVPNELRLEQMAALEKYKPPYVLIAGGRPDQAKHLEEMGIKTYLHVPSPLLLESFMEMGSRRFIFEGKECGGHVGPRSSFILWETMVEKLLENIGSRESGSSYHVIFAGGIHDALSTAAVAALAAPLAARGVRVGVLMGTAYLFTEEAVSSGAIVKKFQEAAINCEQTVLLETGPGHAIRCIDSPYKKAFDSQRVALTASGTSKEEIREELELMNLGRLRLASKGLIRKDSLAELNGQSNNKTPVSNKQKIVAEFAQSVNTTDSDTKRREYSLEKAAEEAQWQHGMYMIGQIASLHDCTLNIKQLHENVSQGSTKLIESLPMDMQILNQRQNKQQKKDFLSSSEREKREPIAIVGMSCLLPKAKNVETYWSNILNKVDAIEEVPLSQWDWRNYYDPNPLARDKIYSKWGGFLADIEFEPTKYGIPPSSLTSIDPMQVMLLEVTDAALKDAGYDKKPFPREKTSVILANAGHGPITALYSLRSMLGWKLSHLDPTAKQQIQDALPEWTEDSFPGYLGNVIAGRVANRFDLGGVNFSIDAACASSLAALYTSVSELRSGNSDVVFLASTDTHNQPGDYLSFSKTHAFSADGHCKTFDASADGIVISEGIAMLVLKRLSDAERDGDKIYALIKGIGGSSDGRDLSLTAPRPAGQIKAMNRAYDDAGINPNTVTLIEAHGTGTVAGDRAEVEALKQVFESAQAQERSCAIGSVKTMIGHTKATAGLASIIKVAKALHHKVLPPTIGVKSPSPACHFESGPFYINAESRPWILPISAGQNLQGQDDFSNGIEEGVTKVRRAGVSAFGFGGTNFHAVLEEYIPAYAPLRVSEEEPVMPAEVFIFRGSSKAELIRATKACLDRAKKMQDNQTEFALSKLAYWQFLKDSDHIGQSPRAHATEEETKQFCLAIVAVSLPDLNEKLSRAQEEIESGNKDEIKDPRGIYFKAIAVSENSSPKLAFLFPGQGSQYPGMLSGLAMKFPEVRETFAQANDFLAGKLEKSLSDYIFPPATFTSEEELANKEALTDTRIAQPAIGAANIAAKTLLTSFAISPDMVAGHSYGEYVALCAAGYIDFASLISVSKQRGDVLSTPQNANNAQGAMAAVACSEEQLRKQLSSLPPSISIANLNSPNQTVIAGDLPDIERAIAILHSKEITVRRIPVSQAFHTQAMQAAAKKLQTILEQIPIAQGSIDVYSNLHGQKYDRSAPNIANRLSAHTTAPVDFISQIKNMYADGARIFLEVGPGNVLTNLTQAILEGAPAQCIAVDRQGRDGLVNLSHALAQLAVCGVNVNFQRLYQHRFNSLKESSAGEQLKGKKLIYIVNSASARLKGQSAPGKIAPMSQVSTVRSVPLMSPKASGMDSFKSNLLGKNLGNQKMENTPKHEIMRQFQESMQQMANSFLETQQRVMLAYLANQQADGSFATANEFVSLPIKEVATFGSPSVVDQNNLTAVSNANKSANNISAGVVTDAVLKSDSISDSQTDSQTEMNIDQLVSTLLDIVAERTGYPVDMIDPSLDLEADLGIDSIKRVEILNKFRRVLPESTQKKLESGIEELAGAKTLQSIIDWLRTTQDTPQLSNNNGSDKESIKPQYAQIESVAGNSSGNNGKHDNSPALAVAESAPVKQNGNHNIVRRGVVSPTTLSDLKLTESQLTEKLAAIKEKSPLVLITTDNLSLAPTLGSIILKSGLVPVILEQTRKTKAPTQNDVQLAWSNFKVGTVGHYSLDLQNFTQVQACLDQLQQQYGNIGALFHLQSLAELASDSNRSSAISLLHLLKYLSSDSCSDLKPKIVTATSMGGKFGFDVDLKDTCSSPVQAAVVGLAKVVAKELPEAICKAVDFDLSIKRKNENFAPSVLNDLALKLLKEAFADDAVIEVGYRDGQRWGLDILDGSFKADFSRAPLDENSVVLITGGARGITAEIAMQVARAYKPNIIIVGRSPMPDAAEDSRYAGLSGIRELKAKIIEAIKAEGLSVNIPQVESRYQALIREREIRNNIARLKHNAKKADYYSLDVRDSASLVKLVERVYKEYGRIDAVIHGAGVIEDALLKDKDKESFARVFDTKVLSALTLIDCLKLDSLKHFFLFSSVVGRTGNAGQSDYVAANEVLNKLASSLRDKMSNGRAAAIMWGPWKGGMAQPELESIFAQYGWAMIDVQKGCESFVDEMFCPNKQDTEVLLVAETADKKQFIGRGARLESSEITINSAGDREYVVELDTQVDAFLLDHAFDGVPVLPMAYALELMCEAVYSSYPNQPLKLIEKFDIPAGILFDVSKKKISIIVHEEEKSDDITTATVSIMSGIKQRRENFKAKFVVGQEVNLELPPSLPIIIQNGRASKADASHIQIGSNSQLDLSKANLGAPVKFPSLSDIYQQWLFHGESFHGMKHIFAAGENGIVGQVSGFSPDKCLRIDKPEAWLIDPVMFDCAMQLGGIWARKCLDITALPTGFRRLQIFSPKPISSDEQVYVHIIICPGSAKNELRCHMALYNERGELLIFVEELSGVGSKSLHRLATQNLAIEAGILG